MEPFRGAQDFRHHFLSWLIHIGRPITEARDIAGHKDLATTNLYAHAAQGYLEDARRAMDQAISDREHQVLQLLASGKTVSEIARQLCRSAKTISTHRSRILEKLGLRTTADLIRFAIQDESSPEWPMPATASDFPPELA